MTISFGQLTAQTSHAPDLNLARYAQAEDEVLFYSAHYSSENNRVVHWVNHTPKETYALSSANGPDAPLVSRTYFAREVKAGYEELPSLESWMTQPFKSSLDEPETGVEEWMITPFDKGIGEEDLRVETWMTSDWL